MSLQVYRPAPIDDVIRMDLARRPASLEGMTVGLVGNLKPNCDVLLHTTEDLLKQRLGVARTVYREKSSCSAGAPESMLDEVAALSDVAVVALAD